MEAQHLPAPLTPEEVAFFRALARPAILLLLMLRLGRPASARELAAILGKEHRTVITHLRNLMALNLVTSAGKRAGYVANPDEVLWFRRGQNGDVSRADATTTTTINIRKEMCADAAAVVEEGEKRGKKHHLNPINRKDYDVIETLRCAGVGEPKRSQLAALPHVTPQAVKAWELFLRQDKRDDYRVGLLVHVLETGDPAPGLNENGHLEACNCYDCQRLAFRSCPDCGEYICQCD